MHIETRIIKEIVARQVSEAGFSGVVLFNKAGQTVFSEAHGLANRTDGVANTPDTRFGIASGTKTFTAVAICRLIEQGLLDFSSLLVDHVDQALPDYSPGITVAQLLTHCSGVADYADEEDGIDYAEIWKTHPSYLYRTPADFLPLFPKGAMKFEPGQRFHYNNSGYILLGLIIEKVSGMGFHDYLQREVFGPSGMVDTGFFELDRLPERTARGYIASAEPPGWIENIYAIPPRGGPDGGLFTTAPDLLAFRRTLDSGRLLGPEMTAQLLAPQIATTSGQPEPANHYGYGLWIHVEGDRVVRQTMVGCDPGVVFYYDFYPDEQFQAIYLANCEGVLGNLRRELQEVLDLPGHLLKL